MSGFQADLGPQRSRYSDQYQAYAVHVSFSRMSMAMLPRFLYPHLFLFSSEVSTKKQMKNHTDFEGLYRGSRNSDNSARHRSEFILHSNRKGNTYRSRARQV